MSNDKKVSLGVRGTPEVKALLGALTDMLSKELGARISAAQAVEVAIREAVAKRKQAAVV